MLLVASKLRSLGAEFASGWGLRGHGAGAAREPFYNHTQHRSKGPHAMTEDKLEQLTVMHRSLERLKVLLDSGTPADRERAATPALVARHRAEVDADLREQVRDLTTRFTEA